MFESISSFEQLYKIMTGLHDCPFDLDRSTFNYKKETWTGTFLRPLWADPRAEHKGLPLVYVRSRLPVVESTLSVSGVKKLSIMEDQGINRYSFNDVERISKGLRFRFNEALYIDLRLSGSIEATYDEQLLPDVHAIYRQYFLMQTGPVIKQKTAES